MVCTRVRPWPGVSSNTSWLCPPLPACEAWLSSRSAYVRMDKEGLLGPIADKTPNRGLAAHLLTAVKEAEELLKEIDQLILAPAEAA